MLIKLNRGGLQIKIKTFRWSKDGVGGFVFANTVRDARRVLLICFEVCGAEISFCHEGSPYPNARARDKTLKNVQCALSDVLDEFNSEVWLVEILE